MLTIALETVAALLVAATLLPLLRTRLGAVRSLDFPRVQVAAALALCGVGLAAASRAPLDLALAAACAAALAMQAAHVLPFTPLWRMQAKSAKGSPGEGGIALLVLNVLQSNRDYGAALDLLADCDPDLILLLETDEGWRAAMDPVRARYPHHVEQPQDNTYGMLFYSRLPVRDPEIRFLLQDDVPSLRARLVLPDGTEAAFHGVHPRPPHPGHDSTPRDAELVVVAREVAQAKGPAIVAGDLNDVAWSRTTRLFQRISGLLDPRLGRGLYPTFHARHPLARWPLDHVFFSEHFLLVGIRRLRYVGSDHFPILLRLRRSDHAPAVQEAPEADARDHREAGEAVEAMEAEGAGPAVRGPRA